MAFASLESRRLQQFHTIGVDGTETWSRTCTICGKFTLVRSLDGGLNGLSPAQRRFVLQNQTVCEAEGREKPHGETRIID